MFKRLFTSKDPNAGKVQRLANVKDPYGGWFTPHAIILACVVGIILYAAGFFTAKSIYTESYFAQRYRATMPVATAPAPKIKVSVGTLPTSGSLNAQRYPSVWDQDGLGECAAYAAAQAMTYEWRMAHPGSWLNFSPRWIYDLYSDTYSSGHDYGSGFPQNVQLATQYGALRFKSLPAPPYQIDYPIPTNDASGMPTSVSALHLPWTSTVLDYGKGEGQTGVDLIRRGINNNHPISIVFGVWPEYDNATQQPLVTSPTSDELKAHPNGRGGHDNVVIAYNDGMPMPDGTYGAVEVQNQWSKYWGVNGRAWLSYDFVRRFVFQIANVHLHSLSTSKPLPTTVRSAPADGGHALVPPPVTAFPSSKATGSWFVRGVYAADRQLDLSPIFNAAGQFYGIAPVGLAATYGSECGLKTGVNGDCNRIGYGNDVSGGGCQVTVGTAAGYGVGDGTYSSANIAYVFNWEDNPVHCIWLEAHVMHDYSAYRNNAQYPALNILWNCGPATTSYPIPYGECATNYFGDFLGWYNYSLTHFGTNDPPPPPPKPQPKSRPFNYPWYCQFSWKHHKTCPSPSVPGHKYTLNIRGSLFYFYKRPVSTILGPGRWFSGGYMEYHFWNAVAYYWPRYGWGHVKVIYHKGR